MSQQDMPLSPDNHTLSAKTSAMSINSISNLAIILYLVSGVLLLLRLNRSASASNKNGILALAAGALVIHAGYLYQDLLKPDALNLGFFNALSLASWLIALLLVLASIRKPVENLGIAVLPMAALGLLLNILFPSEKLIAAGNWQMQSHILISILAYSLLTLAMMQAVLLALQNKALHNRQPGGFVRALPPLQTMESLLFQMISVGFVLLTVSLLTGFFFLEDIFAQHQVHKTVLSILAWLVFAILLWGRFRYGWRGRTALRWTLSGFVMLMLAYFGSKLVLDLILKT